MQPEWLYCLKASEPSKAFLVHLQKEREAGTFLGSTFSEGWSHTCFTAEQCSEIESRLKATRKVTWQVRMFFAGDVIEEDVGIPTFQQPLVQWCPCLIYSLKFRQWIPPEQPWGLTMEGDVLLSTDLREVIAASVTGLDLTTTDIEEGFDVYRIEFAGVHLKTRALKEKQPLTVDCRGYPETDILSSDAGVVLCSLRFARLLKKSCSGFVWANFQPVRCLNVSESLQKRNRKAISVPKSPSAKAKVIKEIRSVEAALGLAFPPEYSEWVADQNAVLPMGWLSPMGGKASEMVVCAKQEREEADPAMPETLVPIYAYGDGDYVCICIDTGKFVQWDHSSGDFTHLGSARGFRRLLKSLSD